MERCILHSDLNGFYASVEMMLDPNLRGKAVAVCGSTEDRHGIVLAKSEPAKKAGVKTGMVTWEARQLCPELIVVPPQYEQYLKYSRLTRAIYQRYTDLIEPFGMDECWLQLCGSGAADGGLAVAHEIRNTVREELGLTVSIGVSFNKVFAKLGSDLKKPDAVTTVHRSEFREKIWPLPASDLIYIGRATMRKLQTLGIRTIGDLAQADRELLKRRFGKNGEKIWLYANGLDTSRVMQQDVQVPIQSLGHGITCTADLETPEEVWRVILYLAQDIGHKLRLHSLAAQGVQLVVKDAARAYRQYQAVLASPTQDALELARLARELFTRQYPWHTSVRALTVRAIRLIPRSTPEQTSLFEDTARRDKRDRLCGAVEEIRSRFGRWAVYPASIQGDLKLPRVSSHDIIMPGMMYQ